jgi:hypothetical protein
MSIGGLQDSHYDELPDSGYEIIGDFIIPKEQVQDKVLSVPKKPSGVGQLSLPAVPDALNPAKAVQNIRNAVNPLAGIGEKIKNGLMVIGGIAIVAAIVGGVVYVKAKT